MKRLLHTFRPLPQSKVSAARSMSPTLTRDRVSRYLCRGKSIPLHCERSQGSTLNPRKHKSASCLVQIRHKMVLHRGHDDLHFCLRVAVTTVTQPAGVSHFSLGGGFNVSKAVRTRVCFFGWLCWRCRCTIGCKRDICRELIVGLYH